jgi:hypothetical protein
MRTERGEWAVVLRIFSDGSAMIRVDGGRDVALRGDQLPPSLQPGEAGRVLFRDLGEEAALFVRRDARTSPDGP